MRSTAKERTRLRETIQYLNLHEIRGFCRAHGLPLHIHVEQPDGRLRKTGDRDRKDVVLSRILDFAFRGTREGPTVYSTHVVSDRPLPSRLTAACRLRYGQYDKTNRQLIQKMQQLTDGAYRHGMIARIVLRDLWTAGTAPTLREFAAEWRRAAAAHTQPRPEGAYLADLAKGRGGADWKQVRRRNARKALEMLDQLVS